MGSPTRELSFRSFFPASRPQPRATVHFATYPSPESAHRRTCRPLPGCGDSARPTRVLPEPGTRAAPIFPPSSVPSLPLLKERTNGLLNSNYRQRANPCEFSPQDGCSPGELSPGILAPGPAAARPAGLQATRQEWPVGPTLPLTQKTLWAWEGQNTETSGKWGGIPKDPYEKVAELTLWFVLLRSDDRGLQTFCKNEKAQFSGLRICGRRLRFHLENIFHICHKKFKMSEDSHRRQETLSLSGHPQPSPEPKPVQRGRGV